MKKAGVIDRAVFGLYVSRYEDMPHSIQIGDYDENLVEGGSSENLHWFPLTVDKMGWRWELDLTDATFGDKSLFMHDFKWIELNASYAGIGLTSEDFIAATDDLMLLDPASIHCDDEKCIGQKPCDSYKGLIPDLNLTISDSFTVSVKGDDLLIPIADDARCQILLQNSGDFYRMGSVALKDYYSIYDVDNFKIGIGKVFDPNAPVPNDLPDPNAAKEDSEPFIELNLQNSLIAGGALLAIVLVTCYVIYKRRSAASKRDIQLPQNDPNLQFIGGEDEDSNDKDEVAGINEWRNYKKEESPDGKVRESESIDF